MTHELPRRGIRTSGRELIRDPPVDADGTDMCDVPGTSAESESVQRVAHLLIRGLLSRLGRVQLER
jgi:hypothetical protein